MSIRPGHTRRPGGMSTTEVPGSIERFFPILAITAPSISTSNVPSRPLAGSTIRPPLSRRFILDSSRQEIEHRHPHGHSVGYLFEDDGVGTVGNLGSNFDTAIHGAGMHDDDVRLGASYALDGHAEDVEVLPQRRKKCAHHALLLDS